MTVLRIRIGLVLVLVTLLAWLGADLAVAVESAHLGKVLDPFLASKALGDGQREYTREELYALADAVGANRIIFGAAGHVYKGKMSITLVSQLRATHPTRSKLAWSAPIASQAAASCGLLTWLGSSPRRLSTTPNCEVALLSENAASGTRTVTASATTWRCSTQPANPNLRGPDSTL